jgi:hypothetical protein
MCTLNMNKSFPENFVTFICQFQPVRNLCLLTAILLLAGCAKETAEEESYFSYTLNGIAIRHTGNYQSYSATGKGVFVEKSIAPGIQVSHIEGFSGMYDGIMLTLMTDSLAAGTYSSGGDPARTAIGIQMAAGLNNGYVFGQAFYSRKTLLVQVTKHSGGRLSGTFSGRVYRPSSNPTDSADISGEFSNLEVRYL